MTELEYRMYRQINADVPRTMTEYKLFTNERIRKMSLRILYVWSKRHPVSGYVQGFNDLLTPFIAIFFTDYVDLDLSTLDVEESIINSLSEPELLEIEADSYWCFKKMMEKIQANYSNGQPCFQYMLAKLEEIIDQVDKELMTQLKKHGIKFLEFSYRWMICYLMREFTLKLIIRLWDTYFSMEDAFTTFHLFVCACLLLNFSDQIKKMTEFTEIMTFLQNLPILNWSVQDLEVLLAKSYQIYSMYGHLVQTKLEN